MENIYVIYKWIFFLQNIWNPFLFQRLASTCSCNSIASSSITGSVGPYRRFWQLESLPSSSTNSTMTTNLDDFSTLTVIQENLTEEILELDDSPKIRKQR